MALALSLSTFRRAVRLKAAKEGLEEKDVVEAILLGQFESSVANGRTIVTTSEAGGSVTFTFPEGLTPTEIMELAAAAMAQIEDDQEPTPPTKRLRVCFDRATL